MSNVTRRGLLTGAAAVGGASAGLASELVGAEPVGAEAAGVDAAGVDAAGSAIGGGCAPPLGPVTIAPDDPRYPDLLLRGNNARFRGEPDYIRLVGSTRQVVDAVEEAVRDGKRIAVRSGGHCFEDFVDNKDVEVVLDMSAMAGIYFDDKFDAFVVESGATLWQVIQTLYLGWGVTLPGGNCGGVGVGGHICGGGYGPLSRRYGSVVDYLYAVEVVTVDRHGRAKAEVATREPHDRNRDLWWAHTGGGGGNFGVVTRYWLRSADGGSAPGELLPKAPARILSSTAVWSWDNLPKPAFVNLVDNYGGWYERNSAPDSPYNALWSVFMASGSRVAQAELGGVLLATQLDATQLDVTLPDARQLLDDYLDEVTDGAEPAFVSEPTELPFLQAFREMRSGATAESGPTKVKAGYLRKGFTPAQIETVYEFLAESPAEEYGSLWLVAYGGQVNAVAPDATAAAQRDSILKAIYISGWEDPAHEADQMRWSREFYAAVYAESGGVPVPGEVSDGSYINYPDTDLADPQWNTSGVPWSELYYKDNYPRLQRVKARWDPLNVFHHGLSVEPT